VKTYRHAAARRMSRNDQRIIDQLNRRSDYAVIMLAAFGYEEMTLPKLDARPARREAQP
jgi:hypothetical protein